MSDATDDEVEAMTHRIRVVLPAPLRALIQTDAELEVEIAPPLTIPRVLDVLEARYPALRGTIRDRGTRRRRAFIRFYACERDLSLDPLDTPLPDALRDGREPLLIVGAMAGG